MANPKPAPKFPAPKVGDIVFTLSGHERKPIPPSRLRRADVKSVGRKWVAIGGDGRFLIDEFRVYGFATLHRGDDYSSGAAYISRELFAEGQNFEIYQRELYNQIVGWSARTKFSTKQYADCLRILGIDPSTLSPR